MYDQEGYFKIFLPKTNIEGTLEVTRRSPLKYRKAVQRFAEYFQREFEYDFPQFWAKEQEDYVAYLLFSDHYHVHCGACCFRRRNYKDIGPSWAMQWLWIHPYFRRRGILTKTWPQFDRFKPFVIERPISEAMIGFLKKHNSGGPIVK